MRASLLLLACTAALGLAPQRRTVSMSAAPRPRSGGNAPRSGGGAPQRGGGAGRGGAPQSRAGDWNCPSCQASNFAYRSSCFRCGTKGSPKQQQKSSSGPRNRQNKWSWAGAAEKGEMLTPNAAVEDLVNQVWWLRDLANTSDEEIFEIKKERQRSGNNAALPDDAAALRSALVEMSKKYLLSDDNFRKSTFNPLVKELTLCSPEVYEELVKAEPPQ